MPFHIIFTGNPLPGPGLLHFPCFKIMRIAGSLLSGSAFYMNPPAVTGSGGQGKAQDSSQRVQRIPACIGEGDVSALDNQSGTYHIRAVCYPGKGGVAEPEAERLRQVIAFTVCNFHVNPFLLIIYPAGMPAEGLAN